MSGSGGYYQHFRVRILSANFLRKGRFLGSSAMGFDLQVSSILGQTKANSVKQDLSPASISMGLVLRLNPLLTLSMTSVVRS
jgi:hypothetical protein